MIFRKNFIFNSVIFFIVVFSLLTSFLIFFDDTRPSHYTLLWILPLIFSIIVFISFIFLKKGNRNTIFLIIISLFFIRNSLTPFFMYKGDYFGFFTRLNSENVLSGILLILFETTVLCLFVTYKSNKYKYENIISNLEQNTYKNPTFGSIAFIICFVSIIGVRLFVPDFFSGYTTIFSSNIREIEKSSEATGPLFTLFTVLLPLFYFFISTFLILKVYKTKFPKILKFMLYLLMICIPLFFMNNSDGFTIISVVALFLVVLKLNDIDKKILILTIVTLVFVIFIYILLMVASMSFGAEKLNLWQKLSKSFQSYIPGVCNYAGVFNIENNSKSTTFFFDIYSTIPFRNSIFGSMKEIKLVSIYTSCNDAISQIIPCGGQMYYYFGPIGILMEVLYISFAFRNIKKLKNEENILMYLTRCLLILYLILTPFLYNFTTFMTRFLLTIVPLFLFSKLLYFKRESDFYLNYVNLYRDRS